LEQLEKANSTYTPLYSDFKCQGCATARINTNLRVTSVKSVDEGKMVRPLYYCTLACLMNFIRLNQSGTKWKKVSRSMVIIDRGPLPSVTRVTHIT